MPLTFILLITQIERLFFAPPSVSLNIERDIEEEKKKKEKRRKKKEWTGREMARNRCYAKSRWRGRYLAISIW